MSLAPRHILLVEDDPQDRELIQAALRRERLPHVVSMMEDGVEALNRLREGKLSPDLVILDLKMPRVSGLDLLAAIRSDPRLGRVPVVMFTSSIEPRNVQAAYAAGANAYVQKPMAFEALMATLSRLMAFWTGLNLPPPQDLS